MAEILNTPADIRNSSDNHKTETLRKKFLEDRQRWLDRVDEHLQSFADVQELLKLQPAIFRNREILIEQKHQLQENCEVLSRIIKEKSKELYIRYSQDGSLKSKSYQAISLLIEGDEAITVASERNQIISNHVNFLDETLQTIDHIIYGINYRVKLEEYS